MDLLCCGWALALACRRVLTRSTGLLMTAARLPLRQPAATFLNRLLCSLSPPSAALMGAYVPSLQPDLAQHRAQF